jgi:hypothetical protein
MNEHMNITAREATNESQKHVRNRQDENDVKNIPLISVIRHKCGNVQKIYIAICDKL